MPDGASTSHPPRRLYLMWSDWTWWAWLVTALLLTLGLLHDRPAAYLAAMAVTAAQAVVMLIREKRWGAFPVQLRLAYLALLGVCSIPGLNWLFWLPTLGTWALVFFGYCLMARMLSLLPWNRPERLSLDLLRRTFFSAPDLNRAGAARPEASGCAGGLCTIEAQVKRRS